MLKLIGVVVLMAGLGGAGVIYWSGTHSPRLEDDLWMVGYDKAESRQMGHLYGKMGPMIDDLLDDLKRPGTQAVAVAAVSAIIAFGCFRFAQQAGGTANKID